MRIIPILLVFFTIPLCCCGQADTLHDDSLSRWQWGISASVDYIKFPASGVLILEETWDTSLAYSDGKAGLSIGTYLSFRFNKRLEGQVGLKYMKKRGYVKYRAFSPPDFAYNGADILQSDYISLPVSLKYYVYQKRNAYFISTGLSVDISPCGSCLDEKIAYSHMISLGSFIRIYDKLSVQLEPVFQYAISDYRRIPHSRGLHRFRPHSFGIIIGIRKNI